MTVKVAEMEKTKNSVVAKNGFAMEKCLEVEELCSALKNMLVSRSQIFKSNGDEYTEYPSGKKTDVKLHPYNVRLQIKRVSSFEKDRGHHVDRRDITEICKFFSANEKIEELLGKLIHLEVS